MKSVILLGDVRQRLSEIPEGSVRTCITSPPYFGLRDYGTASWEDGDSECSHTISMDTKWNDPKRGTSVLRPEVSGRGGNADFCHLCGATRIDSQLGLEATPDAYVAEMVSVFREVWRVLADDGTLWLNIGDSYGKEKQLIGIPWRVAFALQADGWYLRSDIIWAKPNPMPESVRDRPTKSHEYVFLLSKSPKYYYNHEAIKEPAACAEPTSVSYRKNGKSDKRKNSQTNVGGKPGFGEGMWQPAETRNKRDVWTINTKPYKGAHFAVMPEALVEPCVLAGSAEGDTVLDPFTGSGTVAVVANRHGRNFVGTELNPEYSEIAKARIKDDSPMFNEVEVI